MLSTGMKCYYLELILSSGSKFYHLGCKVIIWDELLSSGANVILDEMLSSGTNCYHLELMLSSGMKCYHLGRNVIIKLAKIQHKKPFAFAICHFLHAGISACRHYLSIMCPRCDLSIKTNIYPESFSKAEFANCEEGPPFSKLIVSST